MDTNVPNAYFDSSKPERQRETKRPYKLSYRHNGIMKQAIEEAMKMYNITKSEALDLIIEEWLYYVAGK